MRWLALLTLGCTPKIDVGSTLAERLDAPVPLIELPDERALGLYLQATIHAGSAFDPVGSEGLAAITARALIRGGAGERDATALEAEIYRNGIDLDLIVDREWVTLRLGCHPDVATLCVDLFGDLLTAPRFDEGVVSQQIAEARYRLTDGATEDIEALGREVLETWLYEGHPYGHPVDGRAGVLELLDADATRAFHRQHYVRSAMHAGIAGRYAEDTRSAFVDVLARIPATPAGEVPDASAPLPLGPPELVLQRPPPVRGRSLLAVEVEGTATGFHLGHPLELTRDHPDWPAVHLALSWLGAHRQSHGRLFQALREQRGLNYGTYAYVEPYLQRGWSAMPEQGALRSQPYFSIWIRPVTLENGPFAAKLAIQELEDFVTRGLTQEQVDATRAYLSRRQPIEASSVDRRLAYALEAAAAGVPDPNETLADRLAELDAEAVNQAVARHIRPGDLRLVGVTGDPEALSRHLIEESATPIVYASVEPTEDQAAEDQRVATKVLELTETHIVSSQGIFR